MLRKVCFAITPWVPPAAAVDAASASDSADLECHSASDTESLESPSEDEAERELHASLLVVADKLVEASVGRPRFFTAMDLVDTFMSRITFTEVDLPMPNEQADHELAELIVALPDEQWERLRPHLSSVMRVWLPGGIPEEGSALLFARLNELPALERVWIPQPRAAVLDITGLACPPGRHLRVDIQGPANVQVHATAGVHIYQAGPVAAGSRVHFWKDGAITGIFPLPVEARPAPRSTPTLPPPKRPAPPQATGPEAVVAELRRGLDEAFDVRGMPRRAARAKGSFRADLEPIPE